MTLKYCDLAFLGGIVIIASFYDIRYRRIPNILVALAVSGGLIRHSISSGFEGVLFSMAGCAAGIAVFLAPYLMGKMGAGDVKLMGAVGTTLGVKGAVVAACLSAIVGGVLALATLAVQRWWATGATAGRVTRVKVLAASVSIDHNAEESPGLCYGVAIAVGTIASLLLAPRYNLFG